MNELIPLFISGGATLLVIFTITWLIQLRTKNAAIIDTIWSASFPLLVILYFLSADGYGPRKLLMVMVVTLWGSRLALYLLMRTLGQPEDVRYTALRKTWGINQNILMLRFFYFQAILALVLSLPFALIMVNPATSLSYFEIAGSILWFVAVVGESTADYQLKRYKADPANKGKVCDRGLWYYSRHPNYFFEWLVWMSYFVMALGSPWGYASVICPVMMFYFLTKVTGIAYTEAQMLKSRGQVFAEYQKTTSAFFLLPKKSLP